MAILEGKTVKLRDNDNNVILPRTLAKNVHMADGSVAEKAIADLVAQVEALQAQSEALQAQVEALQAQVDELGQQQPEQPEEPDTPVEPEEPQDPTLGLILGQIYGTGGKSTPMLDSSFVELYNNGEQDASLNGLAIHYCSMDAKVEKGLWDVIVLPDVVVPAKHSFLVHGTPGEGLNPIAEGDFVVDGLVFPNKPGKYVLSKVTEVYPTGLVDPAEHDKTIIDRAYICNVGDEDLYAGDVTPDMIDDISKNISAVQVQDGVWDCNEYKSETKEFQNAHLLPKNMAAGAHEHFKAQGPVAVQPEMSFVQKDLAADADQILEVELSGSVEDFEVCTVKINSGAVAKDSVVMEDGKMLISIPTIIANVAEEMEIKVKSDKYTSVVVKLHVELLDAAQLRSVAIEGVEGLAFHPDTYSYFFDVAEGVTEVTFTLDVPEDVTVTAVKSNGTDVEGMTVQLTEDTEVQIHTHEAGEEVDGVYTFKFNMPAENATPVEAMRIRQVYGTRGKNDGMLTNDFIELYNTSDETVSLRGLSLNYAAMAKKPEECNLWQLIKLPAVDVPAKHSFLIQGQVTREAVEGSDIPMQVADCDLDLQNELMISNQGYKLVLSKAAAAYDAGVKDPFEVDETVIDHLFAVAEDKLAYYTDDVAYMFDDISKNNAALQIGEDVWEAADYKTSDDLPQNDHLLPKNLAAGAHEAFKPVGARMEKSYCTMYTGDLEKMETVDIKLVDLLEDFVVSKFKINSDEVTEGIELNKEESKVVVSAAFVLAYVEYFDEVNGKVEIKVNSSEYCDLRFVFNIIAGENPDAPSEPEEPEIPSEPEEPEVPVEPALAPIVYGYIPVAVVTEFGTPQYDQITLEMVQQGVLKEADAPVEGKIDLFDGYSAEGDYLFIAVRSDIDLDINKDDGLGGHMNFNEDTRGANGVAIMFDGVEYKVYGEIALTDAIWYVYMD